MISLRRLPLTAGLAFLLSTGLTAQPAEPVPTDDDLLVAELEAEIAALSALSWTASASVATSAGWRDNILLSTFAPLRRGFGRAELEAILFRPPRRRWEFVSFLNGDVLRYFSPPPDTAGEQQWSLHAECRWLPADPLRLAVRAVGYWQDTVIDQSESEAVRFVAPTRVQGGFVTVSPRFTLPGGWRVEPGVQVKRNDYRGYSGDYDEPKAAVRLEWQSAGALAFSAAGSELHRRFDRRMRYTAGGRPLPGTLLRFRQREGEASARATWGRDHAWTSTLTAAWLDNADTASGYFDYVQRRLALELEWRRDPWRAVAWAEGGHTRYRTQTVGAGIAPAARVADDYESVLRLERTLGENWNLFAEHRWERSRSNLSGLGYRANTLLAGIRRSF